MTKGWEIGLVVVGGAVAGIELGYAVMLLMEKRQAASSSTASQPTASQSTVSHASSVSSTIALPTYSYTVRSGDTLSGIADCAGTTVSVLVSLNHLSNVNNLSVGQVLTLPNPLAPNCNAATGMSPSSGTVQPILSIYEAFVGGS